MATVTVRQPATINVKVGNKPATVQSITYGTRTLRSATDLTIGNATDGDVITFDAANNSFVVAPTSAAADIDGGFF